MQRIGPRLSEESRVRLCLAPVASVSTSGGDGLAPGPVAFQPATRPCGRPGLHRQAPVFPGRQDAFQGCPRQANRAGIEPASPLLGSEL